MPQRIERDGKFYRIRKGREVEIPAEWLGNTTYPQTIRKRLSRHPKYKRKLKRYKNPKKEITQ